MSIVPRTNGITFLMASNHLPVFPHISPNELKRSPESPIVGSLTYIGKKLATIAMKREAIGRISFLMLHNTIRLMAR